MNLSLQLGDFGVCGVEKKQADPEKYLIYSKTFLKCLALGYYTQFYQWLELTFLTHVEFSLLKGH